MAIFQSDYAERFIDLWFPIVLQVIQKMVFGSATLV